MQLRDNIIEILNHIGENADRTGLEGTPDRVVKMYDEIFKGYDISNLPKVTIFPNGEDGFTVDEMIVDTGTYYSMCEHHMMPFFGKYTFAYIPHPSGSILGLSKVARVVEYYSARLQIQERLTEQIVNYLMRSLGECNPPLGMGLSLTGLHLCKTMRGVKNKGEMTTTKLMGMMKSDTMARNEFIRLI